MCAKPMLPHLYTMEKVWVLDRLANAQKEIDYTQGKHAFDSDPEPFHTLVLLSLLCTVRREELERNFFCWPSSHKDVGPQAISGAWSSNAVKHVRGWCKRYPDLFGLR